MASSSRSIEGANEISEDLVLSWSRDAATLNTFKGTLVENNQEILKELIQCVLMAKVTNGTKEKLSTLLGRDNHRKSVEIRARVLARLIAIALGLHPGDITIDSKTGKESWSPSVDLQTTLRLRLTEALQDDNTVLSYLFKDVLEADDEVMTVIFCDRHHFKKYPVPYFRGCDLTVVQEISKLWLSQAFLRGLYYSTVLEPLFHQIKVEPLREPLRKPWMMESSRTKILEGNFLKAIMLLCGYLQRRTVKAGARLLDIMLSFQNDNKFDVGDLMYSLVVPLVGFKRSEFRKCFFGKFEKRAQEARWHSQGSDQVSGRRGQPITIGPSSVQTDSNLLCWAARRGYLNLIWCVSHGYMEASKLFPNENRFDDAKEVLSVSLLWRVALWCATRHGQDVVVIELAFPPWVKRIDFNDYSGIEQCLPPLHLVSLIGDRGMLDVLRVAAVDIESGVRRTDYLGKTPLDYAMEVQEDTRNFEEGVKFDIFTNDIQGRMQFKVPNNDFKGLPNNSYYATMNTQYKEMPMPTIAYQSCIRQLLQMPGVADRLKELNDMYTTQANFVLIGATLIASVAFVGWLQPPLGYTDYIQLSSSSSLAPTGTYEQYVAMEGHLSVQMFVVFNTLSFFLGIGTMLIGAEATLFVHDNDERTIALKKVQRSIKWMLGFFITSMVCIMVAFICAGLAILPPIQRLKWSMIVSLCVGGCICSVPLTRILFFLAKNQVVKLKDGLLKLVLPFEKEEKIDDFLKDLGKALVNEEDMKVLQDEIEKRCHNQVDMQFSSLSDTEPDSPSDTESNSPDVVSNMDHQLRRMPIFVQKGSEDMYYLKFI